MAIFQHPADVLHQGQGGGVLGHDGGMVAQAVGGVLLDHRVAQAHGADLAVLVGESSQHPHVVVAARHHLLQDHLVRVAAGVDVPHNFGGFVRAFGGVDFLHAVKGKLPIVYAGRRLDNDRIRKAQLGSRQLAGLHRRGQHLGGGVGDAELVAHFIELGLFLHGGV